MFFSLPDMRSGVIKIFKTAHSNIVKFSVHTCGSVLHGWSKRQDLPLTVILIIISIQSSTLSFIPDLKPSYSANPSYCSLSFSSSGLTTWIPQTFTVTSEHSISVFTFQVFFLFFLHFLVVVSARQIKLTHVGLRAHVKTASRVVSCWRGVHLRSLGLRPHRMNHLRLLTHGQCSVTLDQRLPSQP